MKIDRTTAMAVVVAIAIILAGLYMTGYVKLGRESSFKSQSEVSKAIVNISSDVQSIGSTLEDIDSSLG